MKILDQFLLLLRVGLWGGSANPLNFPKGTDWIAIYHLARLHAVERVVYDGMITLSPEFQPKLELRKKWRTAVTEIVHEHKLLNRHLVKIVPRMESEGVHPILLKKQRVAQNYINPIRRQSRDIDLFVEKKDCEKAIDIFLQTEGEPKESRYIITTDWVGQSNLNMEYYSFGSKFSNYLYNAKLQSLVGGALFGRDYRKYSLNGTTISLAPANLDVLYIFNYIFRHFIKGDLTLRYICDWVLFLYRFQGRMDREELLRHLKSFGLFEAWQIFGCLAIRKFGLSADYFPFYKHKYSYISEKVLDRLLKKTEDSLSQSKQKRRKSDYLSDKLYSFYRKQKWLMGIFTIFPNEVLAFYVQYWLQGITSVFIRGNKRYRILVWQY